MSAALRICLLAACLAVVVARYKSTDFTDSGKFHADNSSSAIHNNNKHTLCKVLCARFV